MFYESRARSNDNLLAAALADVLIDAFVLEPGTLRQEIVDFPHHLNPLRLERPRRRVELSKTPYVRSGVTI